MCASSQSATIAAESSAGRAATRWRAVGFGSSFSTCKISPPIRRRAAASRCERSCWTATTARGRSGRRSRAGKCTNSPQKWRAPNCPRPHPRRERAGSQLADAGGRSALRYGSERSPGHGPQTGLRSPGLLVVAASAGWWRWLMTRAACIAAGATSRVRERGRRHSSCECEQRE
jgi:hypothetical protein